MLPKSDTAYMYMQQQHTAAAHNFKVHVQKLALLPCSCPEVGMASRSTSHCIWIHCLACVPSPLPCAEVTGCVHNARREVLWDYLNRLMDVYGDGPGSVTARLLQGFKERVAREMHHSGLAEDPQTGEQTHRLTAATRMRICAAVKAFSCP
jgi:hypothetical protein